MEKNSKIGIRVKIFYSFAESASCIVITLFSTYGLLYLTDIVNITPSTAGLIIAIGMLFSAIIDPIIGIYSDNLKSKWGRRRPLILLSAVPLCFIVWLFFTKVTFSSSIFTNIYYLVLILAYFFFYTLLETPHLALSAEMTQDYNERTNILAWRSFLGQIGSLLAGPVIILLYDRFASISNPAYAASSSVALLSILCLLLIIFSWYFTKGTELFPETSIFKLKDIVSGPLANKSFILLTVAFSLAMGAVTLCGVVGLYYLSYVLMLSDNQSAFILLIIFGISVVWLPVIDIVCSKLGKKSAWSIFLGMWALAEIILVEFCLKQGNFILVCITFFLIGGGIAGVCLIAWSMVSDCVEIDEFKSGQRREGIYFGLMNFSQKCACSLVIYIIGITMTKIGYHADHNQTVFVQEWLRHLNGVFVAVLLLVSIIVCLFVPINKRKHKALREAIELKKFGKPYKTDEFQDIL